MAIKKKTETKVTKNQEQEQAVDHAISVTRAKELENVIMFDMEINGIKVYGMNYKTMQRQDGTEFAAIGWPSRKGNDGKWYTHCWCKLSDKDVESIEKGIEALI